MYKIALWRTGKVRSGSTEYGHGRAKDAPKANGPLAWYLGAQEEWIEREDI